MHEAMDGRKFALLAGLLLVAQAHSQRIPVVRVGLASLGTLQAVRVSAQTPYGAFVPATNQRVAAWKAEETLSLRAEGNTVAFGSQRLPAVYFSAEAPVLAITTASTTRRYRGWIHVSASAGSLVVVNEVPLETYLMGVLPCEMGASSPMEALKAQAVAARTYTLTKIGSFAKYGYDVDDTTRCHVYRGVGVEAQATNDAVRLTSNQILTYNGKPIEALYATVSGGVTADAREAFGGAGHPYLVPVVDQDERGNPYAAHSTWFSWYVDLPGDLVRAKFRERGVDFGEVEDLDVAGRGPSGRAINIRLTTAQGAIDLNATLIRDAFGVDVIRSTLFDIKKTATGFRIEGKGWGHGVGMCQAGAVGRARAGQSYGQILSTYYPGTKLVTVTGPPIAYATRGSFVDRKKFLSGS